MICHLRTISSINSPQWFQSPVHLVKLNVFAPPRLTAWLPLNTSQLLYLIIKMIWQPPDRLVFLGQSQIDNLFQLSLRPAWHHSIHPSVISHPLPRALFHPLLPSGTTSVRLWPTANRKQPQAVVSFPGNKLLLRPETKRWAATTTFLNVIPGRLASGKPLKMKSFCVNGGAEQQSDAPGGPVHIMWH